MKRSTIFLSVAFLLSATLFSVNVLAQYKSFVDIGNVFIPAGYMGCINNINIDPAWGTNAKNGRECFKVSYTTTCPDRWAGIYWVNEADSGANWGDRPGADLSGKKYVKLSFWARGDKGEEIVEFGIFGMNRKIYKDSCPKVTFPGRVTRLTTEWTLYTIEIPCRDLKSVIGGFYWSASWNSNPSGLTFYLDDIFLIEQ